jgi:hypothetical protein
MSSKALIDLPYIRKKETIDNDDLPLSMDDNVGDMVSAYLQGQLYSPSKRCQAQTEPPT